MLGPYPGPAVNIDPWRRVGERDMPTLPKPPTEQEQSRGRLGRLRLAELASFERTIVDAASLEAAAAQYDVKPSTLTKRYGELAGLAGRSTSIETLLVKHGALPIFPDPLTLREKKRGLGPARLAELDRMADELRQAQTVEAAAAAVDRSVDYYCRRFTEMASAAGWESRHPADWLAGVPSRSPGGQPGRPGTVPVDKAVPIGGRVLPETKDLMEAARARMKERGEGGGWDDFIRGASQHVLSGKRFAGVDSDAASV